MICNILKEHCFFLSFLLFPAIAGFYINSKFVNLTSYKKSTENLTYLFFFLFGLETSTSSNPNINSDSKRSKKKEWHDGSVVWSWPRQYPSGRDEATLLSVWDWIRVGLEWLPAPKETPGASCCRTARPPRLRLTLRSPPTVATLQVRASGSLQTPRQTRRNLLEVGLNASQTRRVKSILLSLLARTTSGLLRD